MKHWIAFGLIIGTLVGILAIQEYRDQKRRDLERGWAEYRHSVQQEQRKVAGH